MGKSISLSSSLLNYVKQEGIVDFTHPLAAEIVGLANPLAYLITGGDKKLASDFYGYFTNAALSNATNAAEAKQNMSASSAR